MKEKDRIITEDDYQKMFDEIKEIKKILKRIDGEIDSQKEKMEDEK